MATPRKCAYALLLTDPVQVTVELRLLRADVALWVFVEPILAAHRAEIVCLPLILAGDRRRCRIHLHPTDRIGCQRCLVALRVVRLHGSVPFLSNTCRIRGRRASRIHWRSALTRRVRYG